MPDWQIQYTAEFERDLRWYKKKNPSELLAVLNNLDTYFKALQLNGNPLQIKQKISNGVKSLSKTRRRH